MEIRLSVVAPAGAGVPVDVTVRTPPGATAADLGPALAEASGYAGRSPALFVDGMAVPGGHPVGSPPLLEGALVTLDDPGMRDRSGVPGVLELHVVGGPDCGQVHRLTPGEHVVGRGAEAAIRIEDPDLSRRHARVTVRHAGVTVEDLGSTNGTVVDGDALVGRPHPLTTGNRVVLGSSTVVLRVPGSAPAAVHEDGLGHLLVNRSPRILPPPEPVEVCLPARPRQREAPRVPLLASVVPLALAVPMAVLTHSPVYLLFALMGPAMMLGNVIGDRRSGRRSHARARADHERELTAARARVEAALLEESARRHTQLPDLAELLATVEGPHARLWERRRTEDDLLLLRVGTADLPSRVTVVEPDEAHRRTTPEVQRVPVGVSLADVGVLGVAGARGPATGLVRALIAQACGWHSPRDVRLVVLASDTSRAADLAWTAYLPHCRPGPGEDCRALLGVLSPTGDQVRRRVAELTGLVAERRASAPHDGRPWKGHRVVVVLAGAHRLRTVPGVAALLEEGPGVGVHFLCLDDEAARLPLEARATVHLVGQVSPRLRVQVTGAPAVPDVVPDQVAAAWAERFARALAPLRDATPEDDTAEVPDQARLLDVLPFDATDAEAVARQWARLPRSTMALLGVAAEGPYAVDLRREGPHLLVGGTTGAGKSELLQTVIASLALANRPDELGFVLVDYKGGAAFKDCARLPHTLGLVTDLDDQLAERALVSLRAELTRRERILCEAGVKDIDDYHALAIRPGPALPRLVLVVDEFRVLAEELPVFLDGVLRVAAVGRSLGVHLVLATQRPAGVVTADIKANVSLRIALRVRDRVDSEDVIDAPDAATISERTPGRAVLRSGSGPLVAFQTARVGGRESAPEVPEVEVEVQVRDQLGDPPARRPVGALAQGPTDLVRIVESVRTAAAATALDPVTRPWLPPLPGQVLLGDLGPATGPAVPYAVADRPDRQSQEVLTWQPGRDGHLAFVGAARSGRTSALRTMAGSLAGRHSPGDLHLHALDGGSGGLQALASLPHTGTVVGRQDVPRAARLVSRLVQELTRRQQLLGELGVGSVQEQRDACREAQGTPLPWLVLLVDGWEGLTQAFVGVDHGRPTDQLLRILRDGPAAGISLLLAGGRDLLLSQVSSLVPDKLVLPLTDPTDLVMAGIPSSAVPHEPPPGRAVRAHDHVELQLALLAPGGAAAQTRALAEVAEGWSGHAGDATGVATPLRLRALPDAVVDSALPTTPVGDLAAADWARLGVGGDAAEAVGVDLRHSPAVLVAGPPGSGRSTALCAMARHLAAAARPVAVVAPRPSPVTGLSADGVAELVDAHDREAMLSLVKRHDDLVVLVDDAELLLDTPVEETLVEVLRSRRGRVVVLCAGATDELSATFRGLTTEARRHRTGVLLRPAGLADGDLLGVRVRAAEPGPPGRGLLVQQGVVTPVQVATSG
ncbi:FtsK/SpoIIIE domain-containing protein [Oryzihumus sp.]